MRFLLLICLLASAAAAQTAPPIEPGVSQELAKWRAARYSDIRYKLNLTLEKMSPVLKGTIEIRVKLSSSPYEGGVDAALGGRGGSFPIILDWRKIKGHEDKSTINSVTLNGRSVVSDSLPKNHPVAEAATPLLRKEGSPLYTESHEHLIFRDGVVLGENVIKLDFTSPILTSGSAITRYIDKEDGSEYIYSLFVPSDASTAFPVFDQPDLKARIQLNVKAPAGWEVVTNTDIKITDNLYQNEFLETKPISTYVFAFAAGDFDVFVDGFNDSFRNLTGKWKSNKEVSEFLNAKTQLYVRKSQAAKFKPHAAEVFRLNREAIKYFEQYFDYKFPFPKYDLVLIPEFPFGGMEHAGATFLRESAIIFPQEPTKGDHISRANLIFHEAAHQWFGDTVTMRWFDDLWLKEGFATFMAYKGLEKVMPEANAWKVFYERVKQAAYQTDSTRGTTAIYQPIANLSAAKSAYGAIVYNKAPAFLRQAEFYLGEDKFQTAVRAFLKKNEFKNAGWEDLVTEFAIARYGDRPGDSYYSTDLKNWANKWVTQRGLNSYSVVRLKLEPRNHDPMGSQKDTFAITAKNVLEENGRWDTRLKVILDYIDGNRQEMIFDSKVTALTKFRRGYEPDFVFPNYQDYGYGIFLLDDKSREYVLKNIQNEKDPFLRSMMWGALWDSVREGELDPRIYVELVLKQLGDAQARTPVRAEANRSLTETDETIVASLIGRVSLALNYYLPAPATALTGVRVSAADARASATSELRSRFETVLLGRMRGAATVGERVTFFRAFVANASSEKAMATLKEMLRQDSRPAENHPVGETPTPLLRKEGSLLRTKDKVDIVTRLAILGDPDAPKLLADLEKTETSDDAKRYAYAARAGFATGENKAKYWDDFVNNKTISESWIEAAFGPWNSIKHSDLTLPYLERALKELPNHKRSRKIFFVNGWLGAFIGGQRDQRALDVINKFLAGNPSLDNDLRLKILENMDLIERAVRIRNKYKN